MTPTTQAKMMTDDPDQTNAEQEDSSFYHFLQQNSQIKSQIDETGWNDCKIQPEMISPETNPQPLPPRRKKKIQKPAKLAFATQHAVYSRSEEREYDEMIIESTSPLLLQDDD
jgi:hypothetical protein